MSFRTILIAHRAAAVRDRFAVALADARHAFVTAENEAAARAAVGSDVPVSLALVDLSITPRPIDLVQTLRAEGADRRPVAVFAGTVASAADVPALAALNVAFVNEHAGTPLILPALAPLLFPDSFNRRTSPRRAIGVPVTYRSEDTLAAALTLDVGKGGVGIRTINPLAKGTTVQVRFRLPGRNVEIDATGRVAWSDSKVGMGVQFESLSPEHQRALDAFVDDV
jgi:uncharacterized protein (TIGR02266 family)